MAFFNDIGDAFRSAHSTIKREIVKPVERKVVRPAIRDIKRTAVDVGTVLQQHSDQAAGFADQAKAFIANPSFAGGRAADAAKWYRHYKPLVDTCSSKTVALVRTGQLADEFAAVTGGSIGQRSPDAATRRAIGRILANRRMQTIMRRATAGASSGYRTMTITSAGEAGVGVVGVTGSSGVGFPIDGSGERPVGVWGGGPTAGQAGFAGELQFGFWNDRPVDLGTGEAGCFSFGFGAGYVAGAGLAQYSNWQGKSLGFVVAVGAGFELEFGVSFEWAYVHP